MLLTLGHSLLDMQIGGILLLFTQFCRSSVLLQNFTHIDKKDNVMKSLLYGEKDPHLVSVALGELFALGPAAPAGAGVISLCNSLGYYASNNVSVSGVQPSLRL